MNLNLNLIKKNGKFVAAKTERELKLEGVINQLMNTLDQSVKAIERAKLPGHHEVTEKYQMLKQSLDKLLNEGS